LRQAVEWLPTGRQLVTMKTDCDLSAYVPGLPALDALHLAEPDKPALQTFYETYGFKGLARAISEGTDTSSSAGNKEARPKFEANPSLFDEPEAVVSAVTDKHYDCVLDWAMFDTWLAKLNAAELVAFDTETTSLDAMRAEIVGLSFSVKPGEACYIPLAHSYGDAPTQLPINEVLAKLKPWFENADIKKLGQHIKYDRHVMANHGIEVKGYAHDTMLESYVLEVHKPHGLASLAERHVGRKGLNYEDLCGKGAHQIPFSQVDVARAAAYSCEDSDQTLDVHLALWPLLEADDKLRFIYEL